MNEIVISGIKIERDADGRYSLNDLHKAAGGLPSDAPAQWLRNAQAKALIAEISNCADLHSSPTASKEGAGGGTFAVKELVYAYAMWISAAFHLKVIRAYDALVTGRVFGVPQTYAEALRLAADQAEEIIQKAMQLEAQKPAVEFVKRYVAADGNKGVRQVAQLLNVPNEREFIQWLIDSGFMYRLEGNLTPHANQRHTGRFVIKAGVSRTSERAYNTAKFTPKGVEWIAGEWAKHQVRQPELI